MRNIFFAFLLLWSGFCHSQLAIPSVKFELDAVPVSQVLRLIYSEVIKADYVLDNAVITDNRLVSFRYHSSKGDIKKFLFRFLDGYGYRLQNVGGVDFVVPKPPEVAVDPDYDLFVYKPKYRDMSYLIDVLQPFFKGTFTTRRLIQNPPGEKPVRDVSPTSAAGLIDKQADMLVYVGLQRDIDKIAKLLKQIDVSVGEVVVRAAVYEVQVSSSDVSAFSLAASLLNGRFGVSLGSPSNNDSAFKLSIGGIDAVISALATDTRFHIVSSPSVRVRSGSRGRFSVGQDVPVLGAVVFNPGTSQPIQSIQYQSSGVVLDIGPKVRDSVIDLDLLQQISSFVKTQTGVNSSPTLNKRELTTSISLSDGDVVLLGGLAENQSTQGKSGLSFLPSFMRGSSESVAKTEILIVLQVNKI